jgi:hypothetical protein
MPIVYKNKGGTIFTLLYSDSEGALLLWDGDYRGWWSTKQISQYLTEYKEPVVEKFTRVVLRSFLPGNVFTSNIKHTHTNEVIGHVEFILTDGKLTEARVIDV